MREPYIHIEITYEFVNGWLTTYEKDGRNKDEEG